MKRHLVTIIAIIAALCITACNNQQGKNKETAEKGTVSNTADKTMTPEEQARHDSQIFRAAVDNEMRKIVPNMNTNNVVMENANEVSNNDTTIYELTNKLTTFPQFQGGMDKLPLFLQTHLVYPQSAQDIRAQGIVKVWFIVEKDGSIGNVGIEEGFNKACEEEAIRVVKLFPKWEPGKVGNKPVRVRMVLPINYSIQFQ